MVDYPEALKRLYRSPAYESTMPDELFRSRPLPTHRWRIPGFATFGAGRTLRPSVYSPPDRWLVATADTGELLIFAKTNAWSFTERRLEAFRPEPARGALDEARARTARVGDLLARLSPAFLDRAQTGAEPAVRHELAGLLAAENPGPLLEWHRELVPDFFAWLEA